MLEDDNDNDTSTVFTPKKSNLSRIAISKNAARKSMLSSETPRQDEQRPSYTADALNELKSSTPSTPKDLTPLANTGAELDLAAKFGTDLALRADDGIIPTTAEIEEKKARRKRLARESEYISLHAENSDEDANENSLRPKHKYAETRLVPDDEDVAEGFDEFTSDDRVALGRRAQKEQRRRRKEEISNLINEAEGGGESGSEDDESDDSEVERRRAYEAAQTRKGMEGLRRPEEEEEGKQRPRTPPRITPLPNLGAVVEKFRERLVLLQRQKDSRVKRLEEVRREKEDIAAREVEIQRLLREVGDEYEKLRDEAGIPPSATGPNGQALLGDGSVSVMGRGLESLGNTPGRVEAMSP